MQKIIALIFLMSFFALQYGKLISYWNCKIANSSDARAVHCDCEKILTDTNSDEDVTVLARMHVKAEKTEEWFTYHKFLSVPENGCRVLKTNLSLMLSCPSSGFTGHVFQPPKFS